MANKKNVKLNRTRMYGEREKDRNDNSLFQSVSDHLKVRVKRGEREREREKRTVHSVGF